MAVDVSRENTPNEPLNHLGRAGEVHMVDVGEKEKTRRRAVASAVVRMRTETIVRLQDGAVEKGEVLATARLAGIMAAKKTSDLIPLCHPIALTHTTIAIELDVHAGTASVVATAETHERTGVEMEAMVAASVASLTIYDMLKGIDREITIGDIKLVEKDGGRSGHFVRKVANT